MNAWAGVAVADMLRWGGGSLFWAFRHLIAVRPYAVLLVPERLAVGDLRAASACCPVPYDTVLAALDPALAWLPVSDMDAAPASGVHEAYWMAGPGAWNASRVAPLRSYVLAHAAGLRLAVADHLVALDIGRSHEATAA